MEDIEIKNEFFTNYRTASCCHACLSTDRVLSTLTEYIDIYYKICDNQNMNPPSETYLCWECIALLKKLRMFRRKVAQAQRTLELHYINKQDFHSLSSLTTYLITENTEIKLTHEESDIKPIKQETEEPFEDNVDYTDNIKDESDDETDVSKIDVTETKVEIPNVPETSKYNKRNEYNMKRIMNRKAKYRFLNIKLRKHRRLLVRKVPIKLNEVLTSLEEERCDGSFVKADHKCLYCVAVWDCEDGLEKHNKKWHDESNGSYQCHICHVRCPSQDKLRAHETSHYYRRECKICRAHCCSPSGMDKHLEKHHRMVQCLACELCFRNVRLFYKHYKALHAVCVCDLCGKRCKSRSIIEKHLRHHFGYECPYCKKKLRNSTSYKNHVETQHSSAVSDNSYCVQCDRRFSSDRMYKRHLQTSAAHARERDNTRAKRKYPCPECSNVYSRRTYMNNHYRHVHAKQSKYYCEDCDRHFLNRTRFIDHRRFQHEGVKRDKDKLCNICGRGFAANRTLINHIRTHSGERPFACEYCGAKFTQKHAMLSHVKYIHLKSKRKSSWHE